MSCAANSACQDTIPVRTRDDQDDSHDAEGSPSVNLIPPLLGLIGIGALVYIMSALGLPPGLGSDGLSHCADITDGRARLVCYDQAARPHSPAKGALAPVGTHERERR
jgi:hypothetical protein